MTNKNSQFASLLVKNTRKRLKSEDLIRLPTFGLKKERLTFGKLMRKNTNTVNLLTNLDCMLSTRRRLKMKRDFIQDLSSTLCLSLISSL
jgi:hypothetical protein